MQVNKSDLLRRLKKIEGQVRGVQKMIEEDRYCMDILVQLAAIKSATNNIGLAILEGHTKSCVSNAIRSGDGEQAINEMMEVLRSFVK
jgi:CsoR family transcriptional regulator, copper-sensing transcriptional repressor